MKTDRRPVAVVGVSALFPGSPDETGFWRDILAGRDLIREVPATHWLIEDYYDPDPEAPDKTYARRGAFLDPVPFDALALGIPPSIVPATDTSQLLALIVAQRVLDEAARGQFASMDRERISVILGVTSGQELLSTMASRLQRPIWVKSLRQAGIPESKVEEICERIASHYVPWQESTFPGLLGNVVAGRIANRFDLGGTNCVTDAACASALSALSMAVNELALGQSDLVITGGVDALNDIFMFLCFSKTPALSRTGDCRPFSEKADGTMLGEGLAMVALKRLEDAEAAGDRIYAVLRGVGASSDGRAKSVYAPRPEGQARALRRAYETAGYGPESVELVEAHGTGTTAGDAAEFEALARVFDETGRADRQWCALGSVKSQIGHTKAAAGAAGLFKVIMALHHGALPPTIKVARPDPRLDFPASPFYLNTEARPWVRSSDHPRRASVSSFGFGGSNFHATLEEYVGPAPRALRKRIAPSELVVLEAKTPGALVETLRAIDRGGPGFLSWFARHTQETATGRAAARVALVAADEEDLAAKIDAAAEAIARLPDRPFSQPGGIHYGLGAGGGGLAFLFPGQGSQYPGMGSECALHWREALAAWDLAAALSLGGPERLQDVVFPRSAFTDEERQAQTERLTRTEWAQPAIGAASLGLLQLLSVLGVRPDCVGGHSFGEVVALHAAGVFDAATMLRIARRRGELMAEAARSPGAMTAARAPLEKVRGIVGSAPGVVLANHNAPEQVVLSGPVEAIEIAEAALRERSIAVARLPVATAFHSPVVAASAAPFAAFLEELPFLPPAIPVYANASAAPYSQHPREVRAQLVAQLTRPVRFVEQIEAMHAAGARTFVEIGPGSVLTGLVEKILAGRTFLAVGLDVKGRNGVTAFNTALGRLWASGVGMDLAALWSSFQPVEDPRRRKVPALAISICGTNYGKPYPPPEGAAAMPPPNPEPASLAAQGPAAGTAAGPAPGLCLPPMPASANAPGLAAYQQALRETMEAHEAWQRSMTETHLAFLQAAERSLSALAALTGGASIVLPDVPRPAAAPFPAAAVAAPSAPASSQTLPAAPTAPPSPAPAPEAARDLKAILLAVVSEKTGYPAEMLSLGMDLESDLGIDSIKRVEILAGVRERVADMAEVEPSAMAALRSLGDIVAHLESRSGSDPADSGAERLPGVGEAVTASEQGRPVPVPERFELEAVETGSSGLALPGLTTASRVVVTGGGGVAAALLPLLSSRGLHAERADRADAVPAEADAVIFLGGLTDDAGPEAAAEAVREAFRSSRAAASRLARTGGVFVTVQDTGGDFGLSGSERAWLGGIAGIAKTAALEWPKASVKAIDIARGDRDDLAMAAALAAELFEGGLEREVGIAADGRRFALRVVARPVSPEAADGLDERSVVVATGGGRGITAACLAALARRAHCRFLLLGRTPLAEEPSCCRGIPDEAGLKRALLEAARASGRTLTPPELRAQADAIRAAQEVRATLDAIRSAGGEALYRAVDVRLTAPVREACEEARRRWGPITAIVHGAGVIADKLIAEKTEEQFDAVFDTKVLGLRALLEATADDPLRAICLFSSVAARGGNRGQCDYAAANEVLNKVAALESRRRGGACTVRSFGWGPWEGGMVTPALQAHFEAGGVSLIALDAGADAFVAEIQSENHRAAEVVFEATARRQPAAAGPVAPVACDVLVTEASHPYLADHRIGGAPVLPVVLALEWFARLARAAHPDLKLVACHDVRVLKGAHLEGYHNGGDRFRVSVRRDADSGAHLWLELHGADGSLHYSAEAELAGELPPPGAPPPLHAPLERFTGDLYGRELFHGPQFRIIKSLEGLSAEGAAATVAGTSERGWRGPWCTDAAALDGGLQLAMLWSNQTLGGLTLPTFVGAYCAYRSGAAPGTLRCVLRGRSGGTAKAICDIAFLTGEGVLVYELRGVEMHRRPDRAATLRP